MVEVIWLVLWGGWCDVNVGGLLDFAVDEGFWWGYRLKASGEWLLLDYLLDLAKGDQLLLVIFSVDF